MKNMKLFTSFRLGDLELPNRIVMAPLTRNRATHDADAANELMARYYTQRASAGLIVAEASPISQEGQGYIWTPGCYTDAQVEGWRKVTSAVHKAGGRMFLQIWHVGRVSHVSLQPNNGAPVSSSPIQAEAKTYVASGFEPTSAPRALETAEIPRVLADYEHAARCAKAAGFDGVEIHGANGYLIEQFLKDGCNKRTDKYGGSIENRCRFALEVVDTVLKVWDKQKVGIRISPVTPANGISDSNPQPLYNHFVGELNKRGLVYIHVVEGATGGARDVAPFDYGALRKAFSGAYMANNGYRRDMAEEAIASGRADLVAFGRPFISNPDLVERLRNDAPIAKWDLQTLYGGGEKGYIDYPTMAG
ncbi:MAG: alkene reductase [Hyphomicrobiales bacterium]|nr:alkene reductase [Hyphomicrobiales bacterium]